MSLPSRYATGRRRLVPYPVDSTTADIEVGDMLSLATAGYVQQISAGELLLGFAAEKVSSPSADGDVTILVDTSDESTYWYPPDSGTVTQALCGLTCDVGGAQSIDIDASADDCVLIHEVNTDDNLVRISKVNTLAGVA